MPDKGCVENPNGAYAKESEKFKAQNIKLAASLSF